MAMAIVVGTVIGSGIFKKPAKIAEKIPEFGVVSGVWIVGGLLVLIGALAYAEVAVLLPRAGGNYVFLREGYGRLFGWLWGWIEFFIIRSASIAALATVFTESLVDILMNPAFQETWNRMAFHSAMVIPEGFVVGSWPQRIITVTLLLSLAWVNVRGVRWGGSVQLIITTVKVGSLIAIAVLPLLLLAIALNLGGSRQPSFDNLNPVWPSDWRTVSMGGLSTAFLSVLWAYHGWMNIAPVAEEIKHPQRNLPLSILGGVCIVVVLYLSVNFAYYLMMPHTTMAAISDEKLMEKMPPEERPQNNTKTVATEFSWRLFGSIGAAVASLAVMISVFGALNGNLLVGPRLLYAMGKDNLAPAAVQDVHPAHRTPARSILVLALWSCFLVIAVAILTEMKVLGGKGHFDVLTDFAMFGAVIFETMAVMALFALRWKMPDAERPYRCFGYPILPALYIILPVFVLINMFWEQTVEAVAGVAFIFVGVMVYDALGLHYNAPPPESQPTSP